MALAAGSRLDRIPSRRRSAPDGTRFLIEVVPEGKARIQVVTDWREELSRLAPSK